MLLVWGTNCTGSLPEVGQDVRITRTITDGTQTWRCPDWYRPSEVVLTGGRVCERLS